MPVPDYQTFMRPILELGVNGEISIRTCIERIAEQFQLSEEDRREPVPSGRQSKLDNRVSWARTYLAKAGAVRVTRRAHFKTTERGRTLLTRYSGPIGTKILRQFPEFLDFQKSKNTPVSGEGAASDGNAAATLPNTPEERIGFAFQEIEKALQDELLEQLARVDPKRFESFLLKLMIAMGYGGAREGAARETPPSNDGGIDGVIDEDALGLDKVYLQAKRYMPDKPVGREAVQAFVGALAGEQAGKGVFITTSRFTKAAEEYARNQPLVLIDGSMLAKLMIRYDVGVRTERILAFKKNRQRYF